MKRSEYKKPYINLLAGGECDLPGKWVQVGDGDEYNQLSNMIKYLELLE